MHKNVIKCDNFSTGRISINVIMHGFYIKLFSMFDDNWTYFQTLHTQLCHSFQLFYILLNNFLHYRLIYLKAQITLIGFNC